VLSVARKKKPYAGFAMPRIWQITGPDWFQYLINEKKAVL
jgi:hypothetical protein